MTPSKRTNCTSTSVPLSSELQCKNNSPFIAEDGAEAVAQALVAGGVTGSPLDLEPAMTKALIKASATEVSDTQTFTIFRTLWHLRVKHTQYKFDLIINEPISLPSAFHLPFSSSYRDERLLPPDPPLHPLRPLRPVQGRTQTFI